jgi:hypothetical protein
VTFLFGDKMMAPPANDEPVLGQKDNTLEG